MEIGRSARLPCGRSTVGGSFTEAAKLLGIHPNYLHRLIRNLNLRGAINKSAGGQRVGGAPGQKRGSAG
jgi:predicted transcriptional regulator